MPTGAKLRNRLTLWSFILLLLFLGAGGFFCYYELQLETLKNLDGQLLSIARNFAYDYREVDPATATSKDFCQNFNRQVIFQTSEQAVTLFSLQGVPLCRSRQPLSQQLSLGPEAEAHSASGKAYFESINIGQNEQIRRLTFPIIGNNQVSFHLQLGHSLAALNAGLTHYKLILIAAGLAAAGSLALCQWLFLGLFTGPIKQIAQKMDMTSEENLNQLFAPPTLTGKEIEELANSYNRMAERIGGYLQRSRQFATDVTHELRTPLTILRGETEIGLRGEKSAEDLRQVLNSNLEEISRMGHLVDDLLMLSKSELGEIPLKMEALNLNELLEELFFQGKIIAAPKQITVNLQAPKQKVSLFADANRIRQVFLNLLTNSIKYTPEGGTVTIDWSLQGEMARIIFIDTGIGIDYEHQQHIFDRFYRINKTGNRNDGGSGLGLAIAKWLVEAHGGNVMVCSTPGQGSSFAITLPLTPKPDGSAIPPSPV